VNVGRPLSHKVLQDGGERERRGIWKTHLLGERPRKGSTGEILFSLATGRVGESRDLEWPKVGSETL